MKEFIVSCVLCGLLLGCGKSPKDEPSSKVPDTEQRKTDKKSQTSTETAGTGIAPSLVKQADEPSADMKQDIEGIDAEISEMDKEALSRLALKFEDVLSEGGPFNSLRGQDGEFSDETLRYLLGGLVVRSKYGQEGLEAFGQVCAEKLHVIEENEKYFGVGKARLKSLANKEERHTDFTVTADGNKWIKADTQLEKRLETDQQTEKRKKGEMPQASNETTSTGIPATLAKQANETFESGRPYFIWVAANAMKQGDHIVVPLYCIANPSGTKSPSFACIVTQLILAKYEGATGFGHTTSRLSPYDGRSWTATKGSPEKVPLVFSAEGLRIGHGEGVIIFLIDSSAEAFEAAEPISNTVLVDRLLYIVGDLSYFR